MDSIPRFSALTQVDVIGSCRRCRGASFGAKHIVGRFRIEYVCTKLFLARVEPSQKTCGLGPIRMHFKLMLCIIGIS